MIEVYKDGKLMYTLTSTDGKEDIAIVSKEIISKSSLSPQAFDDVFTGFISSSKTHEEAYCKAEEYHASVFSSNKYNSYDSFRIAKSRRLK
jgi:hypothetical protein